MTPSQNRPSRLRATFETWKIPREDITLVREIPGKFTIEILLGDLGRRSVYYPVMADTLQKFEKVFGLTKLQECKSYVECQFKRKVSDWEEV